MKKIFNKFTKILLLVVMIISDLMTPIKVFADEMDAVTPKKGDVGINETVSDEGSVTVTKGSLDNPGDVMVTKTVKKNGEGKYTVEFEVKGKDAESTTTVVKPVYVVIVLDTSGSMICDADNGSYAFDNAFSAGWDSRSYTAADGETIYCSNARYHSDYILTDKWENAVSGAVTFSENLADLDNTYASVVTFASTATTATAFAHGALSESDFSHPVGGTNLEQGLSNAKSALDGITDANAQKYIVLIGDGEPTFYGNGTKDYDEENSYPTATSNAKTTADNIKSNGINIFTIGYGIDNNTSAQNILKYVSSNTDAQGTYTDNGYYQSANSSGIAGTLQTVFDQLSTSIAGTGATLTDNIGSSFSVDANSSNLITVTESSVSNTDKFDITEQGTKISFDVEINGDEADGWVNVNEGFALTYTDANGEEKTITYGANEPQPQVYWERNTYNYVINYYKDEITNTSDSTHYLGTSGNLSAFNGEVITLNDTEKKAYLPSAGYELSDSNVYTITVDKTKDNVINVLYEKIDLNYIVKYFFDGTENEDLRVSTNPCKYGDEINALDKALEEVPEGYVLDEAKTKEVNDGVYKITDNNTVVNVYYKKIALVYGVKYLFEDENGYAERSDVPSISNIDAKYGDEINALDKALEEVPEGYVLDEDKTKEVNDGKYTITDNDTIVNVYYKKIELTYDVKYLFEGENNYYAERNDVPSINGVDAKYGDEVSYSDYLLENIPTGYVLDEAKTKGNNNGEYTITDNDTVVNVYYKKIELTYDVKYLFEDLNGNYVELGNISGKEDVPAKYGDEVSYSDHALVSVPEGYIIDTTKSTEVNNGKYVIINNDTTVYVYYKRLNYGFTVNYHFNGTQFDEAYTADAVYGSTLKATDYVVENIDNTKIKNKYNEEDYFLDPNESDNSASITVGTDSNSNVLNLHYISTFFEENAEEIDKSTTTKEVTSACQVVDYTITYNNVINNVREGDKVTVTVVDNLPFEIVEDSSNLTITDENGNEIVGVYNSTDKTITWTFEEIISEFAYEYKINKNIPFSVVYKDFADISSSEENKLVNTANGMTTINGNSTDGDTSDSAEIPVRIEGNLTVIYRSKDEVFEKVTITKLAGSEYTTEAKDFFGYHLVEVNGSEKGVYVAEDTITVEYIYELNDGEITNNKVTKEGPEVISDVNDYTEYVFTYDGTVKNYIGKVTLTVTDVLPYEIYSAGYDDRCDYDFENNTFTCKVEYDITEEDYVNGEYNIHEEFSLNVVYGEIDSDVITNKVDSKLELRKVYKDSESSVDSKILKGELLVSYVDEEGNVLDSYTITDHAGLYYETEEREFDGYTFKSSSDNTEGFLIANETVYVEYVYSKNIGTYEELPPFTGIEDTSVNYIGYILAAFLFILLGKKKETKNN